MKERTNMYKITKERILGPVQHKSCKIWLSEDEKWLSNGEWLIRRDVAETGNLFTRLGLQVKFGKLARPEAGPGAEKLFKAFLSRESERFERTWLVVSPEGRDRVESTVYLGAAGSLAFVATLYADLFGPSLEGYPGAANDPEAKRESGAWIGLLTIPKGNPIAALMPTTGPKAEIVAACKRALLRATS